MFEVRSLLTRLVFLFCCFCWSSFGGFRGGTYEWCFAGQYLPFYILLLAVAFIRQVRITLALKTFIDEKMRPLNPKFVPEDCQHVISSPYATDTSWHDTDSQNDVKPIDVISRQFAWRTVITANLIKYWFAAWWRAYSPSRPDARHGDRGTLHRSSCGGWPEEPTPTRITDAYILTYHTAPTRLHPTQRSGREYRLSRMSRSRWMRYAVL